MAKATEIEEVPENSKFVSDKYRAADELSRLLLNQPGLVEKLAQSPEETVKALAAATVAQIPRALEQDRTIYRIVVFSLGMTVLSVVVGVIAMSLVSPTTPIPDVLTALGSAAIGALAGILAPISR